MAKQVCENIENHVLKCWIVSRASQPEYIIARSVLTSFAGLLNTICFVLLVVKTIWSWGWITRLGLVSILIYFIEFAFVFILWIVVLLRWFVAVMYFPRDVGCLFNFEDFWTRSLVDMKKDLDAHLAARLFSEERILTRISISTVFKLPSIPEIRSPEHGQQELESVLANVEAFIYIDNVLEAGALRMLLPLDITKAKKVRFLLTARDDGVKNSCPGKKPKIYKMKGIEDEEAIFILKRKIMEGIDDSQFNNIIEACGGIPLLLTLAASVIGGDDKKQEAYSRLMREKHKWIGDEFKEMGRVFAFAYDSLPRECKDPFLDICAYFNGWKWDIVQDIVGEDALRMFESRSLVTKATNGDASVHDVILTLAHQKSVEESNGKEVRLRFTSARELEKFLEEEDTQGIKGIWLDGGYGHSSLHICASRLDSMHNSLRVLHLETPTKVEGNCNKIFKELIYLKANIIQLPFHVSQLKQLTYLNCEFPEASDSISLFRFP